MDDDARRQRELDDLDGGMDLREILERRVDVAQAKQGDALDQMRAVMSVWLAAVVGAVLAWLCGANRCT